MKNIETLFSTQSKVDSKSILNKWEHSIPNETLRKIEEGVTLEDLDAMVADGIPIRKYHTQITIHGLFDDLQNNYIYGYKNVFQNKNRSIGVKYNAIDEEKRKRIANRLKWIDLRYKRASTETKYQMMIRVDETNFEKVKREMLALKDSIDTSLFFGSVSVWKAEYMGMYYLILDLYINAIYEKNIELLLDKMGATKRFCEEAAAELDRYYAELEEQRKFDELKLAAQRKDIIANKADELEVLKKYPFVKNATDVGDYIIQSFNYQNELEFKRIHVYLPTGKKLPRMSRQVFSNVQEAIDSVPNEREYSDQIFKMRISGYKI